VADSTQHFRAVHQLHPGLGELRLDAGDRAVQVDGAAGVAEHDGFEAQSPRIERRVAHAEVVRQAGEEDAGEVSLAQIAGESGGGGAVVLEERGVGIDVRPKAFAQDQLGLRQA
jgi:hypothetical protein